MRNQLLKSLTLRYARGRRTTIALGCLLALCLAPAALWAGEGPALLVPGDPVPRGLEKAARGPFGPALESMRYVSVDVGALREITGDEGELVLVDDLPIVGHRFDVVLPGEGRVTLQVDQVVQLFPGVTTYAGTLESDHGATFTFSVEDGKLLGSLSLGRYRWVVKPDAAGGLHTLKKLDKARIPRIPDDVDSDVPAVPLKGSFEKVQGSGNVRVLFLHANNVPNAGMTASNIVSEMNQALRNSQVSFNNRITSAGLQLVPANFNGQNRADILEQMDDRVAPFQDLKEKDMFFASADVAFLLIQEDFSVFPGFGRVGGLANNFNPANPYALSTDDYAVVIDLTALHELGHVFGGQHEDYGSGIQRPKIQANGDWMTLMGGYIDADCQFVTHPGPQTCERIPYFSNPAVYYMGERTGIVGAADMESYLESTMRTVSGWHETGDPSAPSPPDPISSVSEKCYGLNEVTWTAQSGATDYELYRSTSSSFTNPTLIYNGTGTSTVINVTYGTWYLRARACDVDGCSNYTAQVSATRFSGCL